MHAQLSILIAEQRRADLLREAEQPEAEQPEAEQAQPRTWRTHLGRRLIKLGEAVAGSAAVRHPEPI